MIKRFRKGGVHPAENKLSRAAEIVNLPPPETVNVSLSQHAGAPATPVVAKGDKVLVGQLIGQSAGFISSNIHAPVSGTVFAVDKLPDAGGMRRQTVMITVEGDQWAPEIDRSETLLTQIISHLSCNSIFCKAKQHSRMLLHVVAKRKHTFAFRG